jgi:hypothetical protein
MLYQSVNKYKNYLCPVLLIVGVILIFPILGHDFLYLWDDQRELLKERNDYEDKKLKTGKQAFYYLLRHQHRQRPARGEKYYN